MRVESGDQHEGFAHDLRDLRLVRLDADGAVLVEGLAAITWEQIICLSMLEHTAPSSPPNKTDYENQIIDRIFYTFLCAFFVHNQTRKNYTSSVSRYIGR